MLGKNINVRNSSQSNNKLDLVEQVLQQLRNKVRLLNHKNKELRAIIEKDKGFKKSMGKAFHDLQSPLLSIGVVANADELPEHKRVALKSAVINATDITNEALNQFSIRKTHLPENSKRQPVLVSAILSEIVEDRRFKYAKSPINFEYKLNNLNAFLFIKISPCDFKRSISNLINNAIDSLPGTSGTIKVSLKANEEWVYIDIWDDGIGIPDKILQKLRKGTSVTHGKAEKGHGFGMAHVHDTLDKNYGEMNIMSSTRKENHGTTIALKFPKILSPDWIADEITFTKNDRIIILDDDESNHQVWQQKFSHILEKLPDIRIKYFSSGAKVVDYINDLCLAEKEDISLLCDYELINQELNGLEVIKKCGISNSYLIANHFIDGGVKKQAVQKCVKIIPKELISSISCKIEQPQNKAKDESVNVHMVLVDDEEMSTQILVAQYYSDLIVDTYSNPFEFLDCVAKYPKDTKIILDNYFYASDGSTYKIDGISIAKKLHELCYINLFLLSGEEFVVPDYLTLILKSDREKIKHLDKL